MSEAEDASSDVIRRRENRALELGAMSPAELREEIARQATAPWVSEGRLSAHVRAHRKDFVAVYGRPFGPADVDALARSILTAPDRRYTARSRREVEWYSVRLLDADSAMIAIVRGERLRTVYLALRFTAWLVRHPEAVEVDDV